MFGRLCAVAGAENVLKDAEMERFTTFRVGGRADYVVNVYSPAVLAPLLRLCESENVRVALMGRGSNLVFDDDGFRGVIIRFCDASGGIRILSGDGLPAGGESLSGDGITTGDGDHVVIYSFAGVQLSRLASCALELGLSGLEFASGIPGSVGGGVVMNAGAYGGQLSDVVVRSDYVKLDRGPGTGLNAYETGSFEGGAQDFGYRHSVYLGGGYAVTGAYFRLLRTGDRDAIGAKMRELNARRREKQPLEYPSAGSAFKRPDGDFAGRLIEAAGLRGLSVGGAQVSEKHCGFIVNRGGATAEDIKTLVGIVRERVYADSGVMLEPEIRFVSAED